MKMNVYELDDGEQWWYSAESVDRVLEMHIEPLVPEGTTLKDLRESEDKQNKYLSCLLEEIEITEIPPDTKLPVAMDDDRDAVVEKTAAQWAEEGEGLIGCTVW